MLDEGLPLVIFWFLGGTAGILSSFSLGNHAYKDKSLGMISNMKTTIGLSAIIIVLLGCPILLANARLIVPLIFAPKEIFLVPIDFEGPIMIVFDQADGKPLTRASRDIIYEIKTDGVLITSSSPTDGLFKREFWYADTKGRPTQQIVDGGHCDKPNLLSIKVVACSNGANYSTDALCNPSIYEGYIIGHQNDYEIQRATMIKLKKTVLLPRMPHKCPNSTEDLLWLR